MELIKVDLGKRSYNIEIARGLFKGIDLRKFNASKHIMITDSNVKRLYGDELRNITGAEIIEMPPGETSKTLEETEKVLKQLVNIGADRDSLIIALGGGVVGDIAGFVASIYKRGIRYIHIPTTLLAQVDSSIGGKTGVNIPEGKNLIGTIYQPEVVVIDVDVLETLPEKEIKNGLAEIIKYAVIKNTELFEYLESNISIRNKDFYEYIIKESCSIKVSIVEQDETESELRKSLNYGHTIGHAIEILSDHTISHGEAVGIGMAYEGKISSELGLLSKEDLMRQNALIDVSGLKTSFKGNVQKLIKIMKSDKKSKNEDIYFVLPTRLGRINRKNNKVAFSVDEEVIRKCLSN